MVNFNFSLRDSKLVPCSKGLLGDQGPNDGRPAARRYCRRCRWRIRRTVIKIHGDVATYRRLRKCHPGGLQDYLRAIVFTYREIQNWREDSWSRDLLTTLLRTNTMVFCGYSGEDAVLHDTIRTVYEDMGFQPEQVLNGNPAEDARAFFVGDHDKREFDGIEILRAASRAAGDSNPGLTDHPNYLKFFLRRDEGRRFPTLDELMLWLFHRVFRRRQQQALDSALPSIATLLLGHPSPGAELQAIRANFRTLCDQETRRARRWSQRLASREAFWRTVAWTDCFQTGLLREFALAETALRNPRPGPELRELRLKPWYYPTVDHPEWTAWTAVVELALRRMIATWRGAKAGWAKDSGWVKTGNYPHPTVLFSKDKRKPAPVCLTIYFTGFDRAAYSSEVRGAFKRRVRWELRHENLPWGPAGSEPTAPTAEVLWRWASGVGVRDGYKEAATYLGEA